MMLIHKEKILWKKRSALDVVNCYHYHGKNMPTKNGGESEIAC